MSIVWTQVLSQCMHALDLSERSVGFRPAEPEAGTPSTPATHIRLASFVLSLPLLGPLLLSAWLFPPG